MRPLAPRPALGAQEVIIETPRHDLDPSGMTVPEIDDILSTMHTRYRHHQEADPAVHTILFKNRGREAGNSLEHAHGQLFSLRGPVPLIDRRERRFGAYHEAEGRCLLCDLDRIEPEPERRRITENEAFVARVPWAPATSLEAWIHPKAHMPSFGQLGGGDRRRLAEVLAQLLRRFRERAGDPAYNAIWHGSRLRDGAAPHLHWYLQIRPRIARQAGFELGSDVDICPSDPAADAALLR